MHMVRSNDVYENVGWMCNLRGDRNSKLPPFTFTEKKSVAISPSKSKEKK